jgi:ubiquitin carboxyl-terminal hydrolase 14
VQFVRFFWKRESNQKAKILRKVDYPLELDVYEFCSDELKQKLQAPRQMLRDAENAKFGLKTEVKASSSKENEVMVSWYPGTLNHH